MLYDEILLAEENSPVKFPAVSAVENRSASVMQRAKQSRHIVSANNLPDFVFF